MKTKGKGRGDSLIWRLWASAVDITFTPRSRDLFISVPYQLPEEHAAQRWEGVTLYFSCTKRGLNQHSNTIAPCSSLKCKLLASLYWCAVTFSEMYFFLNIHHDVYLRHQNVRGLWVIHCSHYSTSDLKKRFTKYPPWTCILHPRTYSDICLISNGMYNIQLVVGLNDLGAWQNYLGAFRCMASFQYQNKVPNGVREINLI